MIPFVRNIAEFSGQQNIESELTKYLHVKPGSEDLTVSSLESLFKQIITFKSQFSLPNGDRKVFTLLFDRATLACALSEEKIDLETKIVLAMAIRLKAEIFMIANVNDPTFVSEIKKNQTYALLRKVEQIGSISPATLKCLKQVTLMTPENIHINSFMYEPILDMSNHHLKKLYEKVSELQI
jgi:hypothetical protein